MQIRQRLESLADPVYRDFQKKLIPGEHAIIGVRMPELRKIASELVRESGADCLASIAADTQEELLLQALIIGKLRLEPEQLLPVIREFIPRIANWAVCDTFCAELKIAAQYPDLFWDFIQPYLQDDRPYFIRFGTVMGMRYFADAQHVEALLNRYGAVRNPDYYVQMGIAWGISECYVHCRAQTMAFLKQHHLDDFTYRKALQKIIESYRVPPEEKEQIRTMRGRT